jgi:hypothetical protein
VDAKLNAPTALFKSMSLRVWVGVSTVIKSGIVTAHHPLRLPHHAALNEKHNNPHPAEACSSSADAGTISFSTIIS